MFEFSSWFEQWFEPDDFQITFHSSLPTEELPIELNIPLVGGKNSRYKTDLVMTSREKDRFEFANNHNSDPIQITLTIGLKNNKPKDFTLSFEFRNFGKTAFDARDILEFILKLLQGEQVSAILPDQNGEPYIFQFGGRKSVEPPPELIDYLGWLEKLCIIQHHVTATLNLPVDGFNSSHLGDIHVLSNLLETGRSNNPATHYYLDTKKPALEIFLDVHRKGKPLNFAIGSNEKKFEICGETITIGKTIEFVSGFPEISPDELSEAISKLRQGKSFRVTIINPEIEYVSLSIMRHESERIASFIENRFGIEIIYLVGPLASLTENLPRDIHIQLAIEGLDEDSIGKVREYLTDFSTHNPEIIDLSDVDAKQKSHLVSHGILLNKTND